MDDKFAKMEDKMNKLETQLSKHDYTKKLNDLK